MSDKFSKSPAYDKLTPQKKAMVDTILSNLETVGGLWQQGWISKAPESAITGKKYRGANNLYLTLSALQKGYTDNRWLTFKQMEERGWSFKTDEEGKSLGKGAGVTIEFFEFRDRETKKKFDKSALDGMNEEERREYMQENVYPVRKYYRLFNADVIDGIPAKEKKEPDFNGYNERAEELFSCWSENEARILYGGSSAYYNPSKDEIHIPEREKFLSSQEFYGTVLHEIGHSTGRETRLNRDLSGKFGSESYAEEELRAEIASLFLEQELGVEVSEKHIENNGRYIKAWKEKITENPNVLFTAIADADKISKYVMEKEKLYKSENADNEKDEYMLPSEIMARPLPEYEKADMTDRGIDSLMKMTDRDIVECALKTGSGEKFKTLYEGGTLFNNEDRDERSLMSRIAVFCNGNKEQILRIFRSSGQYRENKPNSLYGKIAEEAIRFVAKLKGNEVKPTPSPAKQKSGANAKT